MRIQVRVINGATPEIKAITAAMTQMSRAVAAAQKQMAASSAQSAAAMGALTAKTAAAAAAQRSFARHLSIANLEKYGKNLQWTGRQIEFNFTLPLLLAGGAAFKWAMDNERAMTQVKKVYGDTAASQAFWMSKGMSANEAMTQTTAVFNAEIEALARNFKALSSVYGVNLAEVNAIAGEWAAAGASGKALAESVRLTMEAMVLGDMDAAKATESLIAIQAQYGADTEQLIGILGALNAVENQTGATMAGLIDAFSRSAGSARTAGIDYRHLAAMIAALTPAAGSAANAGNALKTIFSRILAPTKDASDLMDKMGLNTKSAAWASKNGTQRLTELAKAFEGLTAQQKANVSAYVASRYQVNRFDVLMRELISKQGYYQKALDATSSKEKIAAQYQRELTTVLSSNPKKFDILTNTIKNLMVDAIIPLIPAILGVMQMVVNLGKAFQNLDPNMQKVIIGVLVGTAVFGTLTRIIGASILLFTRLASTLFFVGRMVAGLVTFRWLTALLADFGKISTKVFGEKGARGAILIALQAMGNGLVWLTKVASASLNGLVHIAIYSMSYLTKAVVAAVRGIPLALAFLRTIPATIGVVFSTFAPIIAGALSKAFFYVNFFIQYQIPAAIMRGAGRIYSLALRYLVIPINLAFMAGFRSVLTTVTWFVTGALPAALSRGMVRVVGVVRTGSLAMMAAWRTTVAAAATIWTMLPVIIGGAMAAAGRVVMAGMRAIIFVMTSPSLLLKGWRMMWAAMVVVTSGGMKAIVGLLARVVPLLFSPWGLAAAAAVGIFFMFRDKIMEALRSAVRGMGNLPTALANIFRAVIRVVARAIEIIRDLLSYLNPFQRHSPSLVDNVKAGVAVIAAEYAKLRNIGSVFAGAISALDAFGRATAKAQAAMDAATNAEQRANVVSAAGPGAGRAYDVVVASMKQVKAAMAAVADEYQKQAAVVAVWEQRLASANAELDKQETILKGLQDAADNYQKMLSDAQARLDSFVNAPLAGERAMNQAILDNTVAQRQLQLAMMDIEQATGPIDEVRNRLALMQGEIETLTGTQTDLRMAGAGSDILRVYDDQIEAIRQQQDAVTDQVRQYDALQTQLDQLATSAERLDLEKYLNFEAVHEQIALTIDQTKELTSAEILAGIAKESAEVKTLTDAYAAATAAVANQQVVVDAARAKAEAIQAAYDKEKATLDALGQAYDALSAQYDDMGRALESFASAAESAMSKAKAAKDAIGAGGAGGSSPALDAFNAGAGGDFADAGLGGGLPARGDWSSQVGDIDALTDQLMKDAQKAFGDLDPFSGIREGWDKAWAWVEQNVAPKVSGVWNAIRNAFTSKGGIFDVVSQNASKAWAAIQQGATTVGGWLTAFWNLIGPAVTKIWNSLYDFGQRIWTEVGPKLMELVNKIKPLFEALWPIIKVVAGVLGGALLGAITIVASVIANVLGPVLNTIIDVVLAVIQIFSGLITFLTGVFTLDFGKMIDGVIQMVTGLWDGIFAIFNGAFQILWGIVKGIVEGVVQFFTWLYDILVGHSIIPDMIKAIVEWFKKLPGWAWDALISLKDKFIDVVTKAWAAFTSKTSEKWNSFIGWLKTAPGDAWNNFIAFKDKVADVASKGWNAFLDAGKGWWNNTLVPWFKGLPGAAGSAIGNVVSTLNGKGNDLLKGLLNGVTNWWSGTVSPWFGGLGGKVAGAVGSLGSTLFNAGKNILQGFLDGLKRKWEEVKSFVGGIGDWIAAHKGPKAYDLRLLVPAGGWIMTGLNEGLLDGLAPLRNTLNLVSGTIANGITSAPGIAVASNRVSAVTARQAVPSGAGARVININGDLVLPNIKSGNDAEDFLKHLESLAG